MPIDPEDVLADAIMHAARAAGRELERNWNVPVFTRQRLREQNPQGGDLTTVQIAPVFTVGWDGVGTTTMPFTPNVSLLDGSFQSTDIVTGS